VTIFFGIFIQTSCPFLSSGHRSLPGMPCGQKDQSGSAVRPCCLFIGPQNWPNIAPAAKGQHQSPIMIRSCEAVFCESLRDQPLVVLYDDLSINKLTNNGHTVQVSSSDRFSSWSPTLGYSGASWHYSVQFYTKSAVLKIKFVQFK